MQNSDRISYTLPSSQGPNRDPVSTRQELTGWNSLNMKALQGQNIIIKYILFYTLGKKNPVVLCSKDVIFNQVLLLAQMVFNNLLDSNRLYKLGINLAH